MYTTAIHCGGHAGYEIAPFVPSLQGLCSLLLTRGKVNEYVVVVGVVVGVGGGVGVGVGVGGVGVLLG